MVELVDTLDSKSNEAIREGSSPSMGTMSLSPEHNKRSGFIMQFELMYVIIFTGGTLWLNL